MIRIKDKRHICKCGADIFKAKDSLCVKCSLKSNKIMPENVELGTYDTMYEISEGNVDVRLREGFHLLNDDER